MERVNRIKTAAAAAIAIAFVAPSSATRAQAAPAASDTRPAPDPGAEGYCQFVRGVAASRADVLQWPRLRASVGTYRGLQQGAPGEEQLADTAARVMAGFEYDLFDIARGATLRGRAQAECERQRAEAALDGFLVPRGELPSELALRARLAVLDQALPQALAFEQSIAAEFAAGRATLDERTAVEQRVHALRLERIRSRLALEAAARAPRTQHVPAAALRAHERTELEVERQEARLRELEAFSLSLQGGYEHVFDADTELPLYGMVTFSYAFGNLFQYAADARAERGRRVFLREQRSGLRRRVKEALASLHALLAAERERLALSAGAIARLEQASAALASVTGDRAGPYARQVWFDLVQARADHAYSTHLIAELSAALAAGGGDAAP